MKAANDNLNDERVGRACDVWQFCLGHDLSRDEAKQTAASVTGLFLVLAEWVWADIPDPANDNGDAATFNDEGAEMTDETIAKALGDWKIGQGWTVRSPAHDDRDPSISNRNAGGRVLDLPGAVCEVIVLADGDGPGDAATRDCAQRWMRQGRRVRIVRPSRGMGLNDVLLGCGPDIGEGAQ